MFQFFYADFLILIFSLWMSPALPKLPDSSSDSEGAGPTAFKTTLLTYLKTYNLACLKVWTDYVKRADFSAVKLVRTT